MGLVGGLSLRGGRCVTVPLPPQCQPSPSPCQQRGRGSVILGGRLQCEGGESGLPLGLWHRGGEGSCWHPCLAKARGAGLLLPACGQAGSTFCSPCLPWAAKRFLSGVKKHLPALLEVVREHGKLVGYILMGAEHLPEHQPPQPAPVLSSPEQGRSGLVSSTGSASRGSESKRICPAIEQILNSTFVYSRITTVSVCPG